MDDIKTTGLETGVIEKDSEEAKGRFMKGYTKGVDIANRTIDGVASTINLDRHWEVILPSAVAARAEAFMKSNAPFLAAHSHRTGDASPTQIGWVIELSTSKADVPCKFRFATTDVAEEWWKLGSDANGKGIAFSIGFYPIRWVYGSVADLVKEFPELKKVFKAAGLSDTDRVRVYTEIELVEISAVPCPANRESIQILAAKFFDTESKGGDEGDGGDRVERFAAALGKHFAESIGEMFDEKIGCLESLRFDVEESLSDIKLLIAGGSDLDGRDAGPKSPDCDDVDDEDEAGQDEQGKEGEDLVGQAAVGLSEALSNH